jgi:hypothetical protein
MRSEPFACLVIHGAPRISRRAKKDMKRNYLRIIHAVSLHKMKEDGGPVPSPSALWRHVRRLRVDVSRSPTAIPEEA